MKIHTDKNKDGNKGYGYINGKLTMFAFLEQGVWVIYTERLKPIGIAKTWEDADDMINHFLSKDQK